MNNNDMNKLRQIALAWKLYKNNTPKVTISESLGIHRETDGIWISLIKKNQKGLKGFLNNYVNAKKEQRKKRKRDRLL